MGLGPFTECSLIWVLLWAMLVHRGASLSTFSQRDGSGHAFHQLWKDPSFSLVPTESNGENFRMDFISLMKPPHTAGAKGEAKVVDEHVLFVATKVNESSGLQSIALLAISLDAAGATELWRFNLPDSAVSVHLVSAQDGAVVIVAQSAAAVGNAGTGFVFVFECQSGRPLWNYTTPLPSSGTLLAGIRLGLHQQQVILIAANNTLTCLDFITGATQCSTRVAPPQGISFAELQVASLDVSPAAAVCTLIANSTEFAISFQFHDDGTAVQHCDWGVRTVVPEPYPILGDRSAIVSLSPSELATFSLFSTTTCEMITNFTKLFPVEQPFGLPNQQAFYLINEVNKSNNWTCEAAKVDATSGRVLWNTTLPYEPNGFSAPFWISPIRGALSSTVLAFAQGRFTALNDTDGSIQWTNTQDRFLDLQGSPRNHFGELVFPMGTEFLAASVVLEGTGGNGLVALNRSTGKVVNVLIDVLHPPNNLLSYRSKGTPSWTMVFLNVTDGSITAFA